MHNHKLSPDPPKPRSPLAILKETANLYDHSTTSTTARTLKKHWNMCFCRAQPSLTFALAALKLKD